MQWIKFNFPSRPTFKIKVGDTLANNKNIKTTMLHDSPNLGDM